MLVVGRSGLHLGCDIAYLVCSAGACGWPMHDNTMQDYRPNWAVGILEYDRHVYYKTHYLPHFVFGAIGAPGFIFGPTLCILASWWTIRMTDQC